MHAYSYGTRCMHMMAMIFFVCCLPKGRYSEAAHEKRLLCAQKCTRGGVGHAVVGWGGSCKGGVGSVIQGWGGVGHVGVRWVMLGWGGSCRGGAGHVGVGHVGVGWVM